MLQASCGRGLTSGGMEKGTELLIHLMNHTRRRRLTSLNQKGGWSGYGAPSHRTQLSHHWGKGSSYALNGHVAERGKPDSLPESLPGRQP